MKQALFQAVMPICVAAVGVVAAHAAGVPSIWNAPVVEDGAYVEYFDVLPSWASGQALEVEELPASTRFYKKDTSTTSSVLAFSTDEILTNTLTMQGSSDAPQASQDTTVYVEMRCKITPFSDENVPSPDAASYKVMLFVDKDNNFVAKTPTATQTSSGVTASADVFYYITARFTPEQYLITISEDGTTPVASFTFAQESVADYGVNAVCFSGSGKVDDLFASYGDPARATAYVTPPAPATGDGADAVNAWVAEQFNRSDRLAKADQDSLAAAAPNAYLVGEKLVVGADNQVQPVNLALKASQFNNGMLSVNLKVNEVGKNGAINGDLCFMAARTYADVKEGNWESVDVDGLTKNFVDGNQEIDISKLTGLGYLFFKPVVVTTAAN